MFGARYFGNRFFGGRYFGHVGAEPIAATPYPSLFLVLGTGAD
jgi:hypothetical protein